MTRSGRVFVAPDPLVRSKDAKVKAKVGMEESNKVNSTQDEDVPTGRFAEKGDFGGKKVVVEEANVHGLSGSKERCKGWQPAFS